MMIPLSKQAKHI